MQLYFFKSLSNTYTHTTQKRNFLNSLKERGWVGGRDGSVVKHLLGKYEDQSLGHQHPSECWVVCKSSLRKQRPGIPRGI